MYFVFYYVCCINKIKQIGYGRFHPRCRLSLVVEHCTCNAKVVGSIPTDGLLFIMLSRLKYLIL